MEQPVNQSDLAGEVDGVPERFVPALYAGELIEAEHMCRYAWAAAALEGTVVLDAGCGMAYGSAILAGRDGVRVVGVDISGAVLDAVRPTMPANVETQVADLRSLPHENDSFDTVVCFEVIEHVDDPESVVKELARVVRPGGVLLVSSPNAEVSLGLNPHHHHELSEAELRETLARSFAHVEMHYQSPWMTVAVLPAALHEAATASEPAPIWKLAGQAPADATYVIAVASNRPITSPAPAVAMSLPAEIDKWTGLWDEQLGHIGRLEEANAALRHQLVELLEARSQLARAQAGASRAPILELELEAEHEQSQFQLAELRHVIADLEQQLDEIRGSTSWRVTAPVRRLTGRVKG